MSSVTWGVHAAHRKGSSRQLRNLVVLFIYVVVIVGYMLIRHAHRHVSSVAASLSTSLHEATGRDRDMRNAKASGDVYHRMTAHIPTDGGVICAVRMPLE